MTHQWRKDEKALYIPTDPEVTEVPEFKFITLDGEGNPNDPAFSEQVAALYALSYQIRGKLKAGEIGSEPYEYVVYPLEGVWTTSDGSKDDTLNKSKLVYKIMIRQPEQVSQQDFEDAVSVVNEKKPNQYNDQAKFVTYKEGRVVQAMHTGSFDTEGATFEQMTEYMNELKLHRETEMGDYQHREIYLSDPRNTDPENTKTVLRIKVR